MDKVEYEIRLKQILELIDHRDYIRAASLADEIEWRKVRGISTLLKISSLYRKVKRYDDSAAILHIAENHAPDNRSVLSNLCEIYILLEQPEYAVQYYSAYCQVAPKDSGVYILRYKFLVSQDAPTEDLITVLEQLKKREPIEEWMYELAFLYHKVGMTTKCIDACDEIVTYFGQGEFVYKALELKALHAPLTQKQEVIYKNREILETATPTVLELPQEEMEIKSVEVSSADLSQYNTINLQRELAENIGWYLNTETTNMEPITETGMLGETRALPNMEEMPKQIVEVTEPEEEEPPVAPVQVQAEVPGEVPSVATPEPSDEKPFVIQIDQPGMKELTGTIELSGVYQQETLPNIVLNPVVEPAETVEQEDGQMALLLPEPEVLDQQITGQISLDEIWAEWDRMCRESDEKQLELTRKRMHEETETLFEEFDESARRGTLEQLKDQVGIYDDSYSLAREMKPLEDEAELEEVVLDDIPEEPAGEEEPEEITFTEPEVTEEEPEVTEEQEISPVEQEDDGVEEIEEITFTEEALNEEPGTDLEPEILDEFEESEDIEETEESEETVETEEIEESEEIEEIFEEPAGDEEEASEEELEGTSDEELEGTSDEELEESEDEEVADEEASEEETIDAGEPAVTEEPADDDDTEDAEEAEEVTMYHGRRVVRTVRETIRNYDTEEKALFGTFSYRRKTRRQIVAALDKISLTAFTGNLIITGEERSGAIALAKNFIKYMQKHDEHFDGRIAKITGEAMNTKMICTTLSGLNRGALIIDDAGNLSSQTIESLLQGLSQNKVEIMIILVDTPSDMEDLIMKNKQLNQYFNARIDLPMPDNNTLVTMAINYAISEGYSLDTMAQLALSSTISNLQTSDHIVEPKDVYQLVDAAIERAERKSVANFFAVISQKRYDEEDRIIIHERDID